MGILDDLSRGASKVAGSISTGIDDTQAKYRLDQLIHDYGLLLFRQQTGNPLPDSEAETARVWREIHETLAKYPKLDPQPKSKAPPPPPPPVAAPPPTPTPPPAPAVTPPPSDTPRPSLDKPTAPPVYGPPPSAPSSGGPPPPPPGYGPPPTPGA